MGVVYHRDTDRSEGRDTGSSRKERFSLFLLSRDFHRLGGRVRVRGRIRVRVRVAVS